MNSLFGQKGQIRENMLASHFKSITYIFFLCIIYDNTLSPIVPLLGWQYSSEINLKNFNQF